MPKNSNLTLQIYNTLKQKILNNELLPNTPLDEKQLCESLGASRTPVREALARLEWEGLVDPAPHHSAIVSPLTLQNILELIQIRKIAESKLIRPYLPYCQPDVLKDIRARSVKALETKDLSEIHKLDYEFHKYLYEASKRRHIIKIMTYITDQSQRVRTHDFYRRRRSEKGVKDHIEIIDALLAEDYDKACALLESHVADMEGYYKVLLLGNQEITPKKD